MEINPKNRVGEEWKLTFFTPVRVSVFLLFPHFMEIRQPLLVTFDALLQVHYYFGARKTAF
jgi:hypothetical protein